MFRFLLTSSVLCFVFIPQVISCATATKAESTVKVDQLPEKLAHELKEVSSFAIEYGADPDTTLGFEPGGGETNKLAPNGFEVKQDGSIRVFDPVHKKVFNLTTKQDGSRSLEVTQPYTYQGLSALENKISTAKNVTVSKTGADTADMIFTDGISKKTVRLKIDGPLASIELIATTEAGDAFVLIERFVKLGSLAVVREVLVVNSNGETKARLKVNDVPFAPPVIEFQLAPDGNLYRMIPGDRSVTFVRYEMQK